MRMTMMKGIRVPFFGTFQSCYITVHLTEQKSNIVHGFHLDELKKECGG